MKATKLSIVSMLGAVALMVGCSTMSNTGKGALIGTGAGAALGAGIGALIGGENSAAIGAAAGAALGAGSGALIGKKMDKKAAELEAALAEQADIATVTDVNGLTAIKVTFDGGILFATNSSTLSATSKTALKNFVSNLSDVADTDITVLGHTDNTGTLAVNEKLSLQRAQAVASYLQSCGLAKDRILNVEGRAYNDPIASNDTAEGRAQNRRVEIFISANEDMIKAAEAGNLQ